MILLAALILGGCGSSHGNFFANSSADGITGNWQIQSSANSTTGAPREVILLGALQSSGGQVSGTFRFTNLAQPAACGLDQVITLTGAIVSKNNLTLTSATLPNGTTVKASLRMMGTQPYSGIGTVEVDGPTCAVATMAAIGSQIASTTGKFSGALSPATNGTPASSVPGTAVVTLTQSAAPGADGQFTATGTLSYQFGSCAGSLPLSGTVSGVGMSFWDVIFTPSGSLQQVYFSGTTNFTATQIKAGYLSLSPAPCSADSNSSVTLNGELNRQ